MKATKNLLALVKELLKPMNEEASLEAALEILDENPDPNAVNEWGDPIILQVLKAGEMCPENKRLAKKLSCSCCFPEPTLKP